MEESVRYEGYGMPNETFGKNEILNIINDKLNLFSESFEKRITSTFKNTIQALGNDINNLYTKVNNSEPKQPVIQDNSIIEKINNLENKIEELYIKQNNIININQDTTIKQETNVFQNVINILNNPEHDKVQQENIKKFDEILDLIKHANLNNNYDDIEYNEKIEKFITELKDRLTKSILTYKKSASKYGNYSQFIQLLILIISSVSIIVQGIGNETYWINSYNFSVHGIITFLTGFYSMYKFSKKESVMKQKITGTSQLILFINAQLKLSKNERMKNDELIKNIIKQQNKLMSISSIQDNDLLDSLLL